MTKSLINNLAAVTGGTLASQIIVLSFSPIITRMYGPEAFGLQGVFLSLISILSPVVALRLPLAIAIGKNDREARQLASLALFVAMIITTVMEIGLQIAVRSELNLLGLESLGALIYLLPLVLLFISIHEILDLSLARSGRFILISKATVISSLVSNIARVGLGAVFSPSALILILIATVSPAINSIILKLGTLKVKIIWQGLSRKRAWNLLHRYADFPVFRVPTDVIGALSQSVPVLMLTGMYSPAIAGYYVLARSVVNLPLNVIGSAVGNVYYTSYAKMERSGQRLFPLVLKATLIHLTVFGFPLLTISGYFPQLFSFVFGAEWQVSGDFASWISLWIVGMLVNIPSVRVLPVIGKQSLHLVFNVVLSICGAVAIVGSRYAFDTPLAAIISFTVTVSSVYVIQIFTYSWLTFCYDRRNNG